MSVFGARGGDQHVRVAFSFIDSGYFARAAAHLPFYLCLQRYVWRSHKGRLGALYRNGLLVSRATRARLATLMGVSHDTADRELAWLVKEGWIQKTYHQKRLHFVLGKWSTGSKTGKIKEMYLADQVVRAHVQSEQAKKTAEVVSELAEPASAPQHPQNCGTMAPDNASQHPQICGHPVRKSADTPSARMRMMNREENREPRKENLPYREGAARCASQTEKPGVRPSAVLLSARSADSTGQSKTSPERKDDQNKYTARTTLEVPDVVREYVFVGAPVESASEDDMGESAEQRKERLARLAAQVGQPRGEIVPADKSLPEPAREKTDAYGDRVPRASGTRSQARGKTPKRLKGDLYVYANTQAPDPDSVDQVPNSSVGLAKFVEVVVQKHFPGAVCRPDNVDLKWCKDLLAQYTTQELYEMVLLLVMDWTNINHSKEFFPPGGDHPLIRDLFRHRKLLATYIGKGFYVVPNYRTSNYQADYARRHGGAAIDATDSVPHVVTEEERIKRLRDQLNK